MSALSGEPACMHWWLPNDEGYSPIVRSIRRFVEERTAPARDIPTEDLRDMKAIFANLKLDDGSSTAPSSASVQGSSSGKGKGSETDVTISSGSGWSPPSLDTDLVNAGSDTYAANYDDRQGYWSQAQNSFGLPKKDQYR